MKTNRSKVIFHEWNSVVGVEKIGKKLRLRRKREQMAEFIELLRENQQSKLLKALQNDCQQSNSRERYSLTVKMKVFNCLIINAKTNKLKKGLSKTAFKEFKSHSSSILTE